MLALKVYVMAYKIDITIAIGITIIKIADRLGVARILIIVCTNFFFFYECLVKFGTIKKKKLMIDIIIMRQICEY
jgi:hypothetical protein